MNCLIFPKLINFTGWFALSLTGSNHIGLRTRENSTVYSVLRGNKYQLTYMQLNAHSTTPHIQIYICKYENTNTSIK